MQHKDIADRIKKAIKQPENFRNIAFSRADLAEIIGISETSLSHILNDEMHTDFHELLNTQRTRYAHRVMQMECHANDTLDEIAIFCGFKSRITFYRHFSAIYGMTPGKFKMQKFKN